VGGRQRAPIGVDRAAGQLRVRGLLVLAALALSAPAARAADVAQHVDPLIGTFGTGWVFPGADVPFGMVQNSPDTLGPLVYAGYMGNDALIRGFSLVHYSGVGVADGGDLPFMPWVGAAEPPNDPMRYAAPFTHADEHAEAGYYSVLLGNGIGVELTAATHTALQRYAFPPGADPYVIVDPHRDNGTAGDAPDISSVPGGWRQTGDREIAGWTFNGHYRVHFVARFDQPVVTAGEHWLKFAPGQTVTMRAGISFVDEDGARRNLDAEDQPFDATRAAAYAAWSAALSRIEVTGGLPTDLKTFYTALYHALLHPNVAEDVDGRYRGFDDVIRDSPGVVHYANFSSWDTYKAQNQLLATLYPDRYADMLRSELDAARQQGHLPRWAEQNFDPGYMTGDPVVPMIADGMCRGLLGDDEAQELYDQAVALRGRREAGLAKGYLSLDDERYAVATTLEYGIADFALALMAERMGRHEDAQRYLAASLNYRNVLDPDTKWLRPRNGDGSWYSGTGPLGFDPAGDQTGYHEGNAWQYQWLVPHDPAGLFERMGTDLAVERLDHLFTLPAEAQNRLQLFGLYYVFDTWAPGNEHDLGAPYLYPFLGQPWKTQAELRAAQQAYRPTIDGLPGNDDLGGLSAWYVWTALGFGPFTPGAPLYMVGAPMFEHASIALGEGGRFTVEAPGASLAGKYVQDATLDGAPLDRSWFGDDAVRAGGTLHLEMGPRANEAWGVAKAPPSASNSSLETFGCVH
jgi:putative alpha-1,2-mannosidase